MWLREEVEQLGRAFWVPLGKEPAAVLRYFVQTGLLQAEQVLEGLPHPSGANAERIAYFLGKKEQADLSPKTNAASWTREKSNLSGGSWQIARGPGAGNRGPLP